MKKFLIISVSVIAVVAIALTVFIKIYVTPERVKAFVIPTAEKSLNRKVDIGEISISLVKGIGLNDFVIKEADEKNDFVKFREFVLKFKLLPLLSKNVIIDELRLVSPAVRIERGKDGRFNFEDIGQKEEIKEQSTGEPSDEAGGLPISLLVNKVAVSDARFSLTDLLNELPDMKSSADINISIKSLDGSDVSTEGSIDISVEELVLKKPSTKSFKDIRAGIKYALTINLETLDLRVDRADLNFQGIPASVKGDIKNIRTSPEVNLAVTVPQTKTAEIQKVAALFTDTKGLSLSGNIAADVKLAGKLKKIDTLKADGSISFDKVGIKYEEVNALLDGIIKFDEKIMNIDLKSTIDKNSAEIKGSVKNYMKNQDINLNIYSQKLFLDQLILPGAAGEKPPAKGGQPAPSKAPVPEKPRKEAEPLDLKITAQGKVTVDTAVYKGMTMSDFYMQYTFRNNRLEIKKLSAKAGRGTLNMKGFVDLSKQGYTYKLSSTIAALQADEIVNSLAPKARDTVFGALSFNLAMNGAGTLPESIKKNIIADGSFDILDGKITGAPITRSLSQLFGIDELKTINLTKGEGKINVRNGMARLDSIFSSKDLEMDPKGNIGLDETLDLAFDLKLSPRLTGKAMSSKIAQHIKNDEGWGMVPILVKGTFDKPLPMVDVEKAGKRIIKREVDRYIDKLLDKEDKEDEGDEGKKQEMEPVKDLLKDLFK
jgi:AsmA protein